MAVKLAGSRLPKMVHMAKPWHVEHAEYIPEQQKKTKELVLFLVGGDGFEPSKSETTDLQSVAFDRSATLPRWSW